jgi:hypothetical protein
MKRARVVETDHWTSFWSHTTERSSEVRDAFEILLMQMSNGGEAWIDQMADTAYGAVLIGSGPSEWRAR